MTKTLKEQIDEQSILWSDDMYGSGSETEAHGFRAGADFALSLLLPMLKEAMSWNYQLEEEFIETGQDDRRTSLCQFFERPDVAAITKILKDFDGDARCDNQRDTENYAPLIAV